MQGKIETKEQDDEDSEYDDLFIAEGLSLSSSKSDGPPLSPMQMQVKLIHMQLSRNMRS